MSQRVRVQNFMISADGYGAGHGPSTTKPFGDVDPGLLSAWAVATAHWPNRTDGGGTRGLDDHIVRDFHFRIGAEIMGRGKFAPWDGHWEDESWQGWWGDEPPFHTPVFVLTHRPRPDLVLSDTTFHFLDATPAEALERAKEAAGGLDVRIGGGVATVLEFLEADLVDEMHVAVIPELFGHGKRLWHSPYDLADRFHVEEVESPSGVTHCFLWRK